MSSMGAFTCMKTVQDYIAAKNYVLSYGKCLYHELKPDGIDVLVYAPGKVDTPLLAK